MAGKRTEMSKDWGTAWSLQGNGEQICQCGEVRQQEHRRTHKDGGA